MTPSDSIPIAAIIQYVYTCHSYHTAEPIIHLLDKFCGTTEFAPLIDDLKRHFKSGYIHDGMCATCANALENKNKERNERLRRAIDALVADDCMYEKRDFAIIHRLIVDCGIWESLTYVDFVRFLRTQCNVSQHLLPSASTLSKVVIQGVYPQWKFVDVKPYVAERFWQVAKRFLAKWQNEMYQTLQVKKRC